MVTFIFQPYNDFAVNHLIMPSVKAGSGGEMDRGKEIELVELARNGHEDAFRQLVEANMRRVYGLALRFTSKHEDADEVAQETFIRAYRSLNRFQGNSRFGTWLYRIAVNCCLSLRRKMGRKDEMETEDEFVDVRPDNKSPSQERLAIDSQTRGMVTKALDTLSKQQRAIFVMKHLQHKTIAEIAEILDCAQGTVKQQLFRAVRKVRDYLAPIMREEVTTR